MMPLPTWGSRGRWGPGVVLEYLTFGARRDLEETTMAASQVENSRFADTIFVEMNFAALVFIAVALGLIAKCGGPPPPAQPQSNSQPTGPCNDQMGVSYSPVGRIWRINEIKGPHEYGTHVLVDGSGNVQWILQSSRMNLDQYAGDNHWYRIEGKRSEEHPDLFIVCALSFSQ